MSYFRETPSQQTVTVRPMVQYLPGTFSFSTAAQGDALVGQHFDPAFRYGNLEDISVRSRPDGRPAGTMVAH